MRKFFDPRKMKRFEKDQLAGLKRDRAAMDANNALNGYKRCRKANCPGSLGGAPQPVELFGNMKSSPDGLDYYCKECRAAATWTAYARDPERSVRWADIRKLNTKARRGAKAHERRMWMLQMCNKHPELPLNQRMFLDDCCIGDCINKKLDHRKGRRKADVKRRISIGMMGKSNNPRGLNGNVKGAKRSDQAKAHMAAAARRRWEAVRKGNMAGYLKGGCDAAS
jgi:hypothetical protein